MSNKFWRHVDWPSVLVYVALSVFGIMNIYSAEQAEGTSILSGSINAGQQLRWLAVSLVVAVLIMLVDARFFITFGYYLYALAMLALVVTLLTAPEIKGARSWLVLGGIKIGQTSEFAKFAAVLALAKFLDGYNIRLTQTKTKLVAAALVFLPAALVLLQNDTGTAIVFFSLALALYREGLPGFFIWLPALLGGVFIAVLLVGFVNFAIVLVLLIAVVWMLASLFKLERRLAWAASLALLVSIGFSYGVDYAFYQVLKPHQQTRINVLIGLEDDIKGAGYNVHQSLVTIGSGGFDGKGYLQGTQTRGSFVPEQTTDFIFCTVGEEFGLLGTGAVVILFCFLLVRIILVAEKQKSTFVRVYGYGLVSILFFHFFLNIAMTLGLFPVIGIPLPFFSYGGSSLLGFTILLFIFLKLDAGLKYYF
ncbi:MAG: rod shape-determining protein RodA [Bacteroidetes bacterium]|nr:rod shape-determining protein RodA [Bacteroidota bacterium]